MWPSDRAATCPRRQKPSDQHWAYSKVTIFVYIDEIDTNDENDNKNDTEKNKKKRCIFPAMKNVCLVSVWKPTT